MYRGFLSRLEVEKRAAEGYPYIPGYPIYWFIYEYGRKGYLTHLKNIVDTVIDFNEWDRDLDIMMAAAEYGHYHIIRFFETKVNYKNYLVDDNVDLGEVVQK